MSELSVALLGPLQVTRDGAPVGGFESDKVRALLALLVVEANRPHSRASLAATLWPERPERAALLNLNQALANLRKILGDRDSPTPLIRSSRERIELDPTAALRVDVARFGALLAACATHAHRSPERCVTCAARRAEAVALYRGPFLEQLAPRDCLPFEEWAQATRENLHRQLLGALEALAAFHQLRDELQAALTYAERLVQLDPWHEPAQRQLMSLLWRAGRRGEALAQFERCRAILAAELGIEPDDETLALRDAILADEQAAARAPRPAAPLSPPTPFVGREAELAQLAEWLGDPACRLVSIVGLGGSGKTRLALEAAAVCATLFADGAQVVALETLERPDELLPAVARGCGLAPGGAEDAAAQLAGHLRGRELLLVLDNMEQLRAAAGGLAALLAQAPRLTMLVTSRERLGLRGERVLDLGGLTLPADHSLDALAASGAGALFLDAARRARGDFAPDQAERRCIVRICAALAGHALALELAAAWAHVLSCAAIERELARGFDLLGGAEQDRPERQRSVGAVLAGSWALLAPGERHALAALAVLPAAFGIAAAEALLDGPALPMLAALAGKALLRREPDERFAAHAFVRQFALDELRRAGELPTAHGRLLAYVVGLVEQAEAHLRSADEAAWLDRLAAEHATIGAALNWALEQGDAATAARLCAVLRWFWYIRGYIGTGRRWVERTVALAQRADLEPALLARLRQGAGVLADEDSDQAAAAAHYDAALVLFRALGDQNGVRIVTNSLGVLRNAQGRAAEARACFEEALRLSRELGQDYGAATSLNNLGTVAQAEGDLDGARVSFEEALGLARAIGYGTLTATVLDNLGDLALMAGEPARALAPYGEALSMQRGSGDTRGAALSLRGLGLAALELGEPARARPLLRESLELTVGASSRRDQAASLGAMALGLAATGEHERAARLAGAAAACCEQSGGELTALERVVAERAAAQTAAALGAVAFALAWAAGQGLSLEQAVEEALG